MLSSLLSLALSLSAAQAAYQGFNYGSTFTDNSVKTYADFKSEFTTAQNLVGTSGFNSARLYTMIQGGTTNSVIEALQAAVDTDTSLLLGMWASGDNFDNELTALKAAITAFPDLKSKIAGLSVGSEDLYRVTVTGIENDSGVGAGPSVIANYISQTKDALSGTAWEGISIGHVDTWDAWTNGTSSVVIEACDWLGVDEYPFFQYTQSNGIENAASLFDEALAKTQAVAGGKDVWITETGWPISGKNEGAAVASLANAKTYWDEVGCPRFGSVNIWWYTLQDAAPTTPNPSFGIVGSTLTETPVYDLSCKNVTTSSSSASSTATSSGSKSGSKTGSSSATATGSATLVGATGASGSATSATASPAAPGVSSAAYSNGTVTTISGQATTLVAATGAATATGSSSGSGSSGSGSDSDSSATASSATSTSSTAASYEGSASNLGSSAVGIFGALAAAVLLL